MKSSRSINIAVLCLLIIGMTGTGIPRPAKAIPPIMGPSMPYPSKSPVNFFERSNTSSGFKSVLPDYPDLIITAIWMNPIQPVPSESFTVTVIVRNQGNSIARAFTVGAKFEPGDVVVATTVEEGLAPGDHISVELSGVVEQTTVSTVAIVVDLENLIDEGPIGERNNAAPFTYRIDYPCDVGYAKSQDSQLEIANRVLATLTDTELVPSEDVLLHSFEGFSFEQVHYDLLSAHNEGDTISRDELIPDTMIGFSTLDGISGALIILSFQNEILQIEYKVYSPSE